jgi:excisionase family DNA binding protein
MPDEILDLRTHPKAFVTVDELSEYWRFHRNTILKWIDKGKLPAMRTGAYRIRTCDALDFEKVLYNKPTS